MGIFGSTGARDACADLAAMPHHKYRAVIGLETPSVLETVFSSFSVLQLQLFAPVLIPVLLSWNNDRLYSFSRCLCKRIQRCIHCRFTMPCPSCEMDDGEERVRSFFGEATRALRQGTCICRLWSAWTLFKYDEITISLLVVFGICTPRHDVMLTNSFTLCCCTVLSLLSVIAHVWLLFANRWRNVALNLKWLQEAEIKHGVRVGFRPLHHFLGLYMRRQLTWSWLILSFGLCQPSISQRVCMLAFAGAVVQELYSFPFYKDAPKLFTQGHDWGAHNGSLLQILIFTSFFEAMTLPAVIQMYVVLLSFLSISYVHAPTSS